ncbi:hypothetical protein CRG98_003734 [Punica granatum]|uniref:Uncharacterized protein n=1 Tax=Punica granatum TaxID=22663 RepID=A0A2I0L522_PUNGR|nr:hypothetical protein CRG98_003734 [Punica granatum]
MDCFGTRGETGLHGKLGMVARAGTGVSYSQGAVEKACEVSCKTKSKCSGDPETQKPILLRLDDRGEVTRFCRLFVPLHAVLLVSACFVLWTEQFTCWPQLEFDNRRRPRNPLTGLS